MDILLGSKVKVIEIDLEEATSPFEGQDVDSNDYVGETGEVTSVDLDENRTKDFNIPEALFTVRFEDGKVGTFTEMELDLI